MVIADFTKLVHNTKYKICYKNSMHSKPQLVLQRAGEKLPYILLSRDGVTQGDPLLMYIYALALLPLVRKLEDFTTGPQLWYADDLSKASNLQDIQKWLDKVCKIGPGFGYFPEPEKCILITKNTNTPNFLRFKQFNIFFDFLTVTNMINATAAPTRMKKIRAKNTVYSLAKNYCPDRFTV